MGARPYLTERTMVVANAMEHLRRPRKAWELYRVAGRNGAKLALKRAATLQAQFQPATRPDE